jgi:Holliday junction resolvase-like predicted endonuclease
VVHNRAQGDIGESSAIQWLVRQGAFVYTPLFRSPYCDLIADMAGRLVRVEVKTSQSKTPPGNWAVAICTRGGNQSWSGMTKRFDPSLCDFLFVHVGDGRRWFIPAARVEASTAIVVGCAKYAEFEIDPAEPLPPRTPSKGATTIATP